MLLVDPLYAVALGSMTIGCSYFAIREYSNWAIRKNILDVPNQRSSHREPVPRGGGVVIVGLTLGGLFVFQLLGGGSSWTTFLGFMMGASLISGVSWMDDLRSLPTGIRFATHGLAAVIGIASLGYWQTVNLPGIGQIHLGLLGLPLTFIWIVGLTNAYNFMDGIDGIAAGQAIVAGLMWSVYGWIYNQPSLMILSFLLTCSSIGFLAHNWPPARIFMGDVGSAFMGYTFSMLPLMASSHLVTDKGWDGSMLSGILINLPFLLDTIYTFLQRLFNGENVFAAHRCHIYQRLVISGHSIVFVSLLYLGLSVIGGVIAMVWNAYNINS